VASCDGPSDWRNTRKHVIKNLRKWPVFRNFFLDIYVERARERDERETKTERLLSEHFNAFPPPVFNAISNEDETCVQDTFSKSVTVLTVKF